MGVEGSGVEWVELADAIGMLRDQIVEARVRVTDPAGAGDRGVRFELGEVTVELGVELARVASGEGGLRFGVAGWGLSAGGKREVHQSGTHRVTVRLTPRDVDGGPMKVRDRG